MNIYESEVCSLIEKINYSKSSLLDNSLNIGIEEVSEVMGNLYSVWNTIGGVQALDRLSEHVEQLQTNRINNIISCIDSTDVTYSVLKKEL